MTGGGGWQVTRCINLAARSGSDLLKCDVSIVPVFTDLDDDTAGWQVATLPLLLHLPLPLPLPKSVAMHMLAAPPPRTRRGCRPCCPLSASCIEGVGDRVQGSNLLDGGRCPSLGTDGERDWGQAMKDGSDKGAWDPWLARPTSRADCIEWQNNDRLTMAEKNKVPFFLSPTNTVGLLARAFLVRVIPPKHVLGARLRRLATTCVGSCSQVCALVRRPRLGGIWCCGRLSTLALPHLS